MGKSFVLKGAGGRPGGYLTQGFGRIRCKVQAAAAGQMEVTLLYADGKETRHSVTDGAEEAWPDAGRTLTGGYVTVNDALLMDSGEVGRRAFERQGERMRAGQREARAARQKREAHTAETDEEHAGVHGEPKGAENLQTEEQNDQATRGEEPLGERSMQAAERDNRAGRGEEPAARAPAPHRWPEHRWPPPPCWPSARYEAGRWTQREAGALDEGSGQGIM